MVDLCQWRVCIGLFNGSCGHYRPFAAEKSFVGLDPLFHFLLSAVACLVGLVVSLIGAVDTTVVTTAEGERTLFQFGSETNVERIFF